MRDIKFRIYDKSKNKIYIQDENTFSDMCIANYILCPKDKDEYFGFKYKDYEIMQYTGLKDKNGIEIYEGDIFEVVNSHEEKFKVWVEYSEKYTQFIIRCKESYTIDSEPLGDLESKDIEVIGNILENKKILGDE